MIERGGPSLEGQRNAGLADFFGSEPERSEPWGQIRESMARFAARSSDIRDHALADAAVLSGEVSEGFLVEAGQWAIWHDELDDRPGAMRVVLMGRTMAGKSSLLSALTGAHFERIGDGRQRFSRDVLAATVTATGSKSGLFEVVDTPGVGARDGAEDFDLAFDSARDADLVLWVASSDSIQEETARALRLLGLMGKPIVVVLNCRQSLQGIGIQKLLNFPDRVFGDRDGLVAEIRRHMATAGVAPTEIVYVHALAASTAQERGNEGAELHQASRIDELIAVLDREYRAHSEARKALRIVDGQRRQAAGLQISLARGAAGYLAQADRSRKLTADIHGRLHRIVASANEEAIAGIAIAIGKRRDWHLTVTEFGKPLEQLWDSEVEGLVVELNRLLEARLAQLQVDVASAVSAADLEWASVALEQYSLHDLTQFDSVLGNRMSRAGFAAVRVGVGMGGAVLGAYIGAVLGLPTGPGSLLTAAVGGLVGFGVGAAIKPLKGLVDRALLGKDGVLQKRREQTATQIGPLLDELNGKFDQIANGWFQLLQEELVTERERNDTHASTLETTAHRWMGHISSLDRSIRDLDYATTAALLRFQGRERLARTLKRATRVPGVCILAQFDSTGFTEAALFPPDLAEKLAIGRTRGTGAEAAGVLSYFLGLANFAARLSKADTESAFVRLNEHVPPGIADTWTDALTSHIGKRIVIESTGKASES